MGCAGSLLARISHSADAEVTPETPLGQTELVKFRRDSGAGVFTSALRFRLPILYGIRKWWRGDDAPIVGRALGVEHDGRPSAGECGDLSAHGAEWTSLALALASGAMPFVPSRVSAAFASGKLEEGLKAGSGRDIHASMLPAPRVVTAAVLIVDVSGFTALSVDARRRLGSEGAERFSLALSSFFSIMIDIVNDYEGDVDCFAGDAVLIVFESYGSEMCAAVPGHVLERDPGYEDGSAWDGPAGLLQATVNRAVACAKAIHTRLDGFQNEAEDPPLRLHSALAAGEVYEKLIDTPCVRAQ